MTTAPAPTPARANAVGLLTNAAIPNTMRPDALLFLAFLAKAQPPNALLVEAGALYGSTAWVMSQNAPASARVVSIDPWEHERWMDSVREEFPGAPLLSEHAFRAFTVDCPNVEAVKGYAPDAWAEETPIDLFFEDAAHNADVFAANMARFAAQLKPGGVLCGDDYSMKWAAVREGVHAMSREWNAPFVVRGTIWAMIKPGGAHPDIFAWMAAAYGPDVKTHVMRADGETTTSHFTWSPGAMTLEPALTVRFDRPETAPPFDITLVGMDGERLATGPSDQPLAIPSEPLRAVRIAPPGGGREGVVDQGLSYQAAFLRPDGERRYTKKCLLGDRLALGRFGGRLVDLRVTANPFVLDAGARPNE